MVENNDELKNVSFIKTIMMMIIVFTHSICFFGESNWFSVIQPEKTSHFITLLSDWLGTFSTYTFTMVSGYIFYYIYVEKKGYSKIKLFFLGKVKRLIIPYCFVSVVWCMPIYYYFYKCDLIDLLYNYMLGVLPNQLWFLLMLFWVFIIFRLLADFLYKNKKKGIVLTLIMYVIGIIGSHFIPNYFQIWTSFRYLFYFYCGFLLRGGLSEKIRHIPAWALIIFDVLIYLIKCGVQVSSGLSWKLLDIILSFIISCIGIFMSWVVLQQVANRTKLMETSIIMFFEKKSMIVYLFHQQVIYFCLYYLNGKIYPPCLIIINFVISLVIASVIAVLFLQSNNIKVLVGEKRGIN